MIAVANLDAAAQRYRDLGFEVRTGGEHESLGTANTIVPFAAGSYIELIGVRDREAARANMPEGPRFVDILEQYDEIPMIFVFRADRLADVSAQLASAGIGTTGPRTLARRDPSGSQLTFTILSPGAGHWRCGFPSFIDWGETPHPVASPGRHDNGARAIAQVEVVVDDVELHARHYRALGLPVHRDTAPNRVVVSTNGIELTVVRGEVTAHGAGLRAIRLSGGGSFRREALPTRPFSLELTGSGA
jgi:hypothetical protein